MERIEYGNKKYNNVSDRAQIYVFTVKHDVHGAVVHAVDCPDLLHERLHAVAAVFGQSTEGVVGESLAVLTHTKAADSLSQCM